MKTLRENGRSVAAIAVGWLVITLAITLFGEAQKDRQFTSNTKSTGSSSRQHAQGQPDIAQQRMSAESKVRPEIEKQRKDLQNQAQSTLDKDAVAAIQLTEKAVSQIVAGNSSAAAAAIEQAIGKINVVVARNPSTALIPVEVHVDVIDVAPPKIEGIEDMAKAAKKAVNDNDYPAARVLLYGLTSEIRARTYNIPLASYPEALKEAARLLDQKKNDEASSALLVALNTLVVTDKVTPIPIVLAQRAISDAEAQRQKDKNAAHARLETAKNELARAKALGYAASDPEYAGLNSAISDLEKQIQGGGDTGSVFANLKERVHTFLKRHSERTNHS